MSSWKSNERRLQLLCWVFSKVSFFILDGLIVSMESESLNRIADILSLKKKIFFFKRDTKTNLESIVLILYISLRIFKSFQCKSYSL